MKSAISLVIACLMALPTSATAQDSRGLIASAATREAIRLAAVDEPASSRVDAALRGNAGVGTPLELKWNELAPLVVGQRVELLLAGQRIVEGEAIAVRAEGLLIDVMSASDRAAYPKGNGQVARQSIELIKLVRTRGSWGRNLGTVVGVLSGLVVGGYVTGQVANSAGVGIPLFLGMTSGIAVAGYYSGKELDTKVTLIRVVP